MIAVAATGSVGETTAPRTKAAAHGRPGTIAWATTATMTIVSEDEPDREQPDRAQVGAQVAQRGEERGAVEERRQDADEDEVGRQVDLGQARDEAEREAAEHEQDRVRDPQLRDEHEHRCACRQQHEEADEVVVAEIGHAPVRRGPCRAARAAPTRSSRARGPSRAGSPASSRTGCRRRRRPARGCPTGRGRSCRRRS